MQKIVWMLAVIFFLTSAPIGAEESVEEQKGHPELVNLHLQDAVKMGIERNPQVQAMEFGIERSRSQTKSVRGRFLPRLSAGYSYSHLDSTYASGPTDVDYLDQAQDTWRVTLSQTLFAGMTIYNSYQKAQLQEHASRLEKENKERELIRRIQEYFLLLLKAREDRRSLEQTVERLRVSLAAAESFASRQMLPFVEVLRARVELEDAGQKLSQVENLTAIYTMHLDSLLDLENPYAVSYVGDLDAIRLDHDFELEQCLQTALEKRIDLEFIQNNIRMAEKEKAIALGEKLPRVTMDVSAIGRDRDYEQPGRDALGQPVDRDQANEYWSAGVNVEWQFFAGGERYYRRQSMDYEIKRLQRLYDDAVSSIRTDVRSAYLRLEESRQRIDATRANLETARESYRMEEERLKRQVGTIQNLLTAQDQLTRAEAGKNQALLDYQIALADLYIAMGVRNEALD